MDRRYDCKIVLETGEVFEGFRFGAARESVCELVFNTCMVGYQEIITDPSYFGQAVVMTYPIIGNYGITDEDYETKVPTVAGLIVRDYNDLPSNFRSTKTLGEILEDANVPAIYGLDTRRLTRRLRDGGTCKAIITDIETPDNECLERIKTAQITQNPVSLVSCRKKWYARTEHSEFNIVAIDCGIKNSMIKNLKARACNVTVVPYNTTVEEIEKLSPDGIFLSAGPGTPDDIPETVTAVKQLQTKYPVFGVGLGCQLIAAASGAKVYKLKFGHRGANHPVRDLATDKLEIVNQNHGYAIDEKSLAKTDLTVTHKNALDGTVEGVKCEKTGAFGVQFHPDAASPLYEKFIAMIKEKKNA